MKTNIFIVSYTSYSGGDNYMHHENRIFAKAKAVPAFNYYRSMRNNATENANDIYADDDDNDRKVTGKEQISGNNATFTIEREVGTEFSYQAEVRLEEIAIDLDDSRYMKLPYKVGDRVKWYCDDDQKVHSTKITGIDIEIDKTGHPLFTFKTRMMFKGCMSETHFGLMEIKLANE